MTAFRERGAVAPKALGGWRHSKLDPRRVFILRRVAEKDDISMPELAGELQAASGVKADPASLSRWLIRNGLSFKKKAFRPANAIGPTCARRARRGKLNDSPRCGLSPIGWSSSTKPEPSFDRLRTKMTRARGRCDRGQRLRSKAPFGHWKTQTFVAGLRCGALTAPWVIDAPMDRAIFETYVRTQLVPTLQEGDIVILDNLPAHKSPAAEQAIRERGAWLMFLPPYSPDLNPIEMAFAKLKAHLRAMAMRTIDELWKAIGQICDLFTSEECANYFEAAGYGFI